MKTYHFHPFITLFLFLGIVLSSTLLNRQELFSQEWFSVQLIWWVPAIIAVALFYYSQIIKVDGKTIIRKSIFSRTRKYNISDVISVKAEGDARKYGEIKSLVVRLRDGDFFNLFWMREKDLREIVEKIRSVTPNAIDADIEKFIQRQQ